MGSIVRIIFFTIFPSPVAPFGEVLFVWYDEDEGQDVDDRKLIIDSDYRRWRRPNRAIVKLHTYWRISINFGMSMLPHLFDSNSISKMKRKIELCRPARHRRGRWDLRRRWKKKRTKPRTWTSLCANSRRHPSIAIPLTSRTRAPIRNVWPWRSYLGGTRTSSQEIHLRTRGRCCHRRRRAAATTDEKKFSLSYTNTSTSATTANTERVKCIDVVVVYLGRTMVYGMADGSSVDFSPVLELRRYLNFG